MSLTQLLFSFQGRINRKPWWLTGLATFVIMMILIFAIFAVIVVADAKGELGSGGPMDFVMAVLYLILGAANLVSYDPMAFVAAPGLLFTAVIVLLILIFTLWIGLALGAKRLHDRNKSVWWLLIFWVLPGILQGIGEQVGGLGFILGLDAYALSIWGLVEMGFLRGTVGPNRHGPDPLESQAFAPAAR